MTSPPPPDTIERWAWDYILTTDLEAKLAPPKPPSQWESAPPARRIERPARPPELTVSLHATKTPGPEALRSPDKRAQLIHTFLHHELQAAELMAWAVLSFPATPRAFRGGLIHILLDEVRHMGLYRAHLQSLGHKLGDYPVRDWFWERVPKSQSPAEFVATLGIGFEGANLDHTTRFAERFRAIGDEEGARIQEQVGLEEIPHARFALRWFRRFVGTADFATWSMSLPDPLSPILMRGKPIDRESRRKAGFPDEFMNDLSAYQETPRTKNGAV